MAKFAELQVQVAAQGLNVVQGWRHVMLHQGTCRRDIYKAMYAQLVYGSGLVKPGTTIIYPMIVREVVRERFPEADAGVYDRQYKNPQDGKHVTIQQMAGTNWRSSPKTCIVLVTGRTYSPGYT